PAARGSWHPSGLGCVALSSAWPPFSTKSLVAVRTTGLVAPSSRAASLQLKSCSTPAWDLAASSTGPLGRHAGPPWRLHLLGAWNASWHQGNGASGIRVAALQIARLWELSLQHRSPGEVCRVSMSPARIARLLWARRSVLQRHMGSPGGPSGT